MLEFDEGPHQYKWNGKVVPSVTQILQPLSNYAGIPKDILENAARRGTLVHRLTELHDSGQLDPADITEEAAPYMSAYRNFLELSGFEVILNEMRMYHEDLQYAGTMDRYGQMKGKEGVLDIKCTAAEVATAGPQTAAYREMYQGWSHGVAPDKLLKRWVLYLKKDGKFFLGDLESKKFPRHRTDWPTFKNLLTTYWNIETWKEINYGNDYA